MVSRLRLIALVFLVLALIFGSFGFGFRWGQRSSFKPAPAADQLGLIDEVWDVLNQEYVDPKALDPEKLGRGAVKGLLEALDDPYTSFLDSQVYEMELSNLAGKFEGIGAHVTMKEGQLVVIAPVPGSPAAEAGIRAGDKILTVNGESISGLSLAEAVLKIRGPKGTTVRLQVLHEGETKPVELSIVRAEIKLTSVSYEVKEGLGYLRINHFNEQTPEQVEETLRQLLVKGVKGLVLDLRDNPGGLLTSVVDVTSQFVDKGVVLYELDREGGRKPWEVRAGGLAVRLPVAILVNSHSASGSEVLAGALQDNKRAPLIGTKTFGKGSVNVLRTLEGGSALYITRARWLTPEGRLIEGQGLLPDIEVSLTSEEQAQGKDPQLERAIAYLKEGLTP